jgi:hypothetical protein
MPRRANRTRGGRLRVTNDAAIPVGAEVEVRPEHLRALNNTSYQYTYWVKLDFHC